MAEMLNYKGYTGRIEYDDEAGLLHGQVIDLRDVITFQGKSVEEIEAAFRDSVDDYLELPGAGGRAGTNRTAKQMTQPQTVPMRESIPLTPRIVRLDADPQDYIISAEFETGEMRRFNVKPLLDRGVFQRIRNRQAFTTVRIDDLGGVAWDAGPDLCRDTIYLEGVPG